MSSSGSEPRPRVLRAGSSQVAFWIAVALVVFFTADAVVRGAWDVVLSWGAAGALIVWALWLVQYHSCVRLEPSRIVVQNLLRRHEVPWGRVEGIVARPQVALELADGRRLVCWGAPFPRRQSPRSADADARPSGHDEIVDALEHARAESAPSDAPVRSSWDLRALVIGVALLVLTVAATALTVG
ncbi:PH domain-containing protein [Microbacterium sp. No. 7]|uniref:PH domain-containing protein n=1 Tax=Microbacterium sp. No. 7 TaxID=1714373 RepID=UPI0006D0C5F2|nr:PH domain-containing protein [Microbacterium sp. No. 7]